MPYNNERVPEPNKKEIYRWDSKKAKPIVEKLWKRLVEPKNEAERINLKSYTALEVYLSDKDFFTHFKYNTFRPHLKVLAEKALELQAEKGSGTPQTSSLSLPLPYMFIF